MSKPTSQALCDDDFAEIYTAIYGPPANQPRDQPKPQPKPQLEPQLVQRAEPQPVRRAEPQLVQRAEPQANLAPRIILGKDTRAPIPYVPGWMQSDEDYLASTKRTAQDLDTLRKMHRMSYHGHADSNAERHPAQRQLAAQLAAQPAAQRQLAAQPAAQRQLAAQPAAQPAAQLAQRQLAAQPAAQRQLAAQLAAQPAAQRLADDFNAGDYEDYLEDGFIEYSADGSVIYDLGVATLVQPGDHGRERRRVNFDLGTPTYATYATGRRDEFGLPETMPVGYEAVEEDYAKLMSLVEISDLRRINPSRYAEMRKAMRTLTDILSSTHRK